MLNMSKNNVKDTSSLWCIWEVWPETLQEHSLGLQHKELRVKPKIIKTYLSGAVEMYFAWNSVTFSGTSVQRIAYRRNLVRIGNRWKCKPQQCQKNTKIQRSFSLVHLIFSDTVRTKFLGTSVQRIAYRRYLVYFHTMKKWKCSNPWLEMAETN